MSKIWVDPWGGKIATRAKTTAVILGLALGYLLLGHAGLAMAVSQPAVTLIWAPSGLALAALLIFGLRVWPGVFLGAAAVNVLVVSNPASAGLIAVGNTLEAAVGYLLLRRANFDPALRRSRDVVLLLALGAVGSTTIAASVGVSTLSLLEGLSTADLWPVWLDWWLGDAGGVTVVAPIVILGVWGAPTWDDLLRRREAWLAQGLLAAAAVLLFATPVAMSSLGLAALFAPIPLLVWIGLRLGPRGAMFGCAGLSLVAVWGTARGHGPFVTGNAHEDLLQLWAYLATVGTAALILAASVAEREDAVAALLAKEKQQRELEQEVRHVQRLDSLGVLAGGVAHDFNNLLTVIRGNANLLKGNLDPSDAALIDDIDLASQRAAEMCGQLLTYAGRSHPALQDVQIGALAHEIERLLAVSVSKKVRLSSNYSSDDPPVRGDPSQLRQVVMNLVLNAADACHERRGAISVRTSIETLSEEYLQHTHLKSNLPGGRYVVLTVEDEGAGMTEETMHRIFEPFFTTKITGRGLGLAATLGIVRSHSGAIKVRSTLGVGTQFRVILPIADAPATVATLSPLVPSVLGGGDRRILIVDDEPAIRDLLHRALTRQGWSVTVSVDGMAALSILDRDPNGFDGLVLDLTMPNMDGVELLRRVRRLRPDMPAVLMSGFSQGDVLTEFDRASFLGKPFAPDQLVESIENLLGPARPATEQPGAERLRRVL